MKKLFGLLLLIFAFTLGCERDDLCDENTPTTPKMVIEFRDSVLNENAKNVVGLRVEDLDGRVLEGYTGNSDDLDQMILPLKTNENTTQFRVYKNYLDDNGTISGNPDVITISYATEEIYVSRACSYKSIFKNISFIIEDDGDNWMLTAVPENDNQTVLNENETHYTIRH